MTRVENALGVLTLSLAVMAPVLTQCSSNPCKKIVDHVCAEVKNKGQCEAYQTSLGDMQADHVAAGCEAALADPNTLGKIVAGMKKVGEEVQEATKEEGGAQLQH